MIAKFNIKIYEILGAREPDYLEPDLLEAEIAETADQKRTPPKRRSMLEMWQVSIRRRASTA